MAEKFGFASMDENKQRPVASNGGEGMPAEKRSFSQDPALAVEAGRRGGQVGGSAGGSASGGHS
jgi:general stress protein YciG